MSRPAVPLLAFGLASAFPFDSRAEVQLEAAAPATIAFEGLLQADFNWFDSDVVQLNGDDDDREFQLRRAEFVFKGKAGHFDWVLGYDAKAGRFLDTSLRLKLGPSYLVAGQFKQPIGLEELSSTRQNDFIAKALPTNLFGVGRRLGLGHGQDARRWGYSLGVFGRELANGPGRGSGFAARGYVAPVVTDASILHIGLAVMDVDTDADSLRLQARPGGDLAAARLLDTGALRDVDRQRTYGTEVLWLRGPVKIQMEAMQTQIDRYGAVEDHDASSGYFSALWNVGGATWRYKGGLPTMPLPQEGGGLLQLGLRIDHADLDDGELRGGRATHWTLGANWYWRTNFKLSANYVKVESRRHAADGVLIQDDPSIIELRAQYHW